MTSPPPPSKEHLRRWDVEHVWHPFTPMRAYAEEQPPIIARAEGPYLYDIDGKAYIDAFSSLWCNVHGHTVRELDDAVREQLTRVAHSTLLGLGNVPSIVLARRLAEIAPGDLQHVFFSDSGATAVEVALKIAFQYWRQCPEPQPDKTLFLAVGGAYHGDTLGDVSIGDIDRFHEMFRPLLFESIRAPAPYCYRCPLGLERPTCEMACAGEFERLVRENADRLAAVVIEPLVQGAAGMVTAPAGYLSRVREVTRECGVLMIADEVAVGFGRTGRMFACEHEDVVPDLLCLAKGITGGYLPLAATIAPPHIYNAFLGHPDHERVFCHGHTYTGNPLGCAVALANLDLLQNGVLAGVAERELLLQRWLCRMTELEIVGEVRQRGLMAGVEVVANRQTREPFPSEARVAKRVSQLAIENGVMIRPLGEVLVVMPPLNIEMGLLERIGEVLYNALRQTQTEVNNQE